MKNVAVIAGGNSGEYEVSLKTGQNICQVLDKELFHPYFIHFKGTEWTYAAPDGRVYPIDKNDFSLTIDGKKILFDIAFIAIHGNPGEDGKLQGYFEMLNVPYTGCDLLTSAVTFNKYFCNVMVSHLGVSIAPSLHFYSHEPMDVEKIEKVCGYPCFVKPCNSGSSVGTTKVHSRDELKSAFDEAFRYDKELLVEWFIKGCEVTCGVAKIEGRPKALAVTEIVSKKEFYDFESKYAADLHDMITPARLPQNTLDAIMRDSEKIYAGLGCKGVVRFDYIVTEDGKPFFLEVNTIPGQTALSIIPHQVQHLGKDLKQIYTDIIMEVIR